MKHIFVLALLLSASLFSSRATAQAWQQTNGTGGDGISSIAVNAQGHIFIASRGLHRSTDGGVSWTHLLVSVPLWSIGKIAIQPSGRIIISRQHGNSTPYILDSLLASDDNGNSWIRLNVKTGKFWQGSSGMLFAWDSTSYIRSTDNGNTWGQLLINGINGSISSFSSDASGHLFLCANSLYRSTDDGISWAKIVNGINSAVTSINVAPNGDLYAVGYDPVNLYHSTDAGRTWNRLFPLNGYVSGIYALSIDKTGNLFFIDYRANIYFSSDTGGSWTTIQQPNITFDGRTLISSVPESSGSFLFSVNAQFFRWTPTGMPIRLGASNGAISSIIAHPDGNIIAFNSATNDYAAQGWIWFSSNQGNSWKPSTWSQTIASVVDSSKDILAGDNYGGQNGYIINSADSGKTWKTNSPTLTTGSISGLAVRSNGDIFAASTTEGIFRSTDRGVTWDQLNSGISNQHIFSLAVHQNGDVYAGSQNIIYKSTDVGLHWTQLTTNFPKGAGNVSTLVVSTQGNIIAGVDNAGVFWSTDNGATWTLKALGLNATKINALVSTPSGKVFAATNSGIFFLDIIPGANWIQLNSGLTATNVLSLCRDQSGRLFAGTDVSGVFSSINTFNIAHPNGSLATPNLVVPTNGSVNALLTEKFTWNSVPKAKTYQVTISKTSDFSTIETMSDYLTDTTFSFAVKDFSMTYYWRVQAIGEGEVSLYSESWSFTTSSNADVKQTNSNQTATSLGANYPNPFSLSTTIPFTLGERSYITLEVFDQLGRNCSTLASGNYNAGSYEAKFSVDNLSTGMYFVRLKTEKESLIKAIEIIK